MGLVTSFVEPVVKLLSLPFIILTLGLFLFVINALMLMLTGWLADRLDLGFHVDGFWTAVLGVARDHRWSPGSSTSSSTRTDRS